jgi:hypothetical protein
LGKCLTLNKRNKIIFPFLIELLAKKEKLCKIVGLCYKL